MPEETATAIIEAAPVVPVKDDVYIQSAQKALTEKMKSTFRASQAVTEPVATTIPAAPAPETQPAAAPKPVEVTQADSIAPPAPPAPAMDESVPVHERAPAGMSKTGSEHWDRFRLLKNAEVEKERTEKAALKKQIDDLSSRTNGHSPELDILRKEKADLESRVERYDLAESPRFKQHYDRGIEEQLAVIKEVSGQYGDEVVKIVNGERTPENRARLKEIKEELGIEGDIITGAAAKIVQLRLERTSQLNNHKANLQLLRAREAQEAQESESNKAAHASKVAESIAARAKELPEFKPAPTDTTHVQFASAALDFIRNANLGKLAQNDAALLPVQAMQSQFFTKFTLPKLTAEIEALKTRISELSSAKPKTEGGHAPTAEGVLAATTDPSELVAAMVKKYRQDQQG